MSVWISIIVGEAVTETCESVLEGPPVDEKELVVCVVDSAFCRLDVVGTFCLR